MPPQPRERELFVSERPVRSDYGRERTYARRRIVTVTVLALLLGGAAYGLWAHRSVNPADIPTIKAESNYKQKPADPGGIDIPHQDVEVYDKMDNKNAPLQGVEHLLPPPETPKDVPHTAVVIVPAQQSAPQPEAQVAVPPPVAAPAPATVLTTAATTHPPKSSQVDDILGQTISKSIATTVVPTPVPLLVPEPAPPPAAPPAAVQTQLSQKPLSIDDILKKTQTLASPSSVKPSVTSSTGHVAVQLASVPNQAQGQAMMKKLQEKYAADLGGATLRLLRADLGSRGVHYRIQSQNMSEDSANRICSALKQKNTGCFLVRK